MDDRQRPALLPRLAAGLVAAFLVTGCDSTAPKPTAVPQSPSPTSALETPLATAPGTQTAAPSLPVETPQPTLPPAASEPCTAADLKASHGLVEGAAGSVLTEVVLVAAVTCSIDAFPLFGLRDANGAALIGGASGGPGRIDVSPDASYTSGVRLANWCQPEPAFPLELVIRIGSDELVVTGGSFPEEAAGMPPCSGESSAPLLEGSAWTKRG
ncbi:MAG TPA: hypothetical protein VNL94_00675 [Candidatus Binatia bacterium]|nr:hypothetical protein [Candidatus Binatia bacterium]